MIENTKRIVWADLTGKDAGKTIRIYSPAEQLFLIPLVDQKCVLVNLKLRI